MKTIYVQNKPIEVTDEIYKLYWQDVERARYLDKLSCTQEWSMSDLESRGMMADHLQGLEVASAESDYLKKERMAEVKKVLVQLPANEKEWLLPLLLGDVSERQMALKIGVSPSTIHARKKIWLDKIRKMLA